MAVVGNISEWQAEALGLEVLQKTIGEVLDERAVQLLDKEAVVYSYPEAGLNLRLTYKQYREEVEVVAKGLLALGVCKGDHVGIWAPNVPEWILIQMAVAKIGAVLLTINTAYRTSELEYVLRQGDVVTLLLAEEYRGHSYLETLRSIAPELDDLRDPLSEVLVSSNLPRLKHAILIGQGGRPGVMSFQQLRELGGQVSAAELGASQSQVRPDDVALVMYTSGTTGAPKGVMLTHSNLLNDLHLSGRNEDFSEERVVNPMPLFHIGGCAAGVLACLLKGCTLIQMLMFDPNKQLDLISSERGTWSFTVPTMLKAMLQSPRLLAGEIDLRSLKRIGTGGASVPPELIEQVRTQLGAECEIAFGQTECSGAMSATRPSDSAFVKSSTVGVPFAHTAVKITNPETAQTVNCGETGEILVRGPLVMKGYYKMPQATAQAIDSEGWLHTGDLGTMDPLGYLTIVGRLKDVIIRNGENIYPAELESLLKEYPGVADAQVVGIPDEFAGEEIAAFVRLEPAGKIDVEELREYCRSRVSRFKVPRYLSIVKSYPMTATGKVQKFELKAGMLAQLKGS